MFARFPVRKLFRSTISFGRFRTTPVELGQPLAERPFFGQTDVFRAARPYSKEHFAILLSVNGWLLTESNGPTLQRMLRLSNGTTCSLRIARDWSGRFALSRGREVRNWRYALDYGWQVQRDQGNYMASQVLLAYVEGAKLEFNPRYCGPVIRVPEGRRDEQRKVKDG